MFAAKQDVDRKSSAPALGFRRQDENTLVVVLSGDWKLENDLPAAVEVSSLARSVRSLGDYLERHPEALVRGKSSPKGE